MTIERRWLIILIVACIPSLLLAGWAALHNGYYDPKNIAFVLWRHDLWKIDKDRALSIMTHASNPDSLVVGKTRSEIMDKFGPLTPMADASAYVRSCVSKEELTSGNSMMLRHSEWMVTFSGDRAIRLTLVKGC
jgi:hypothetical protein